MQFATIEVCKVTGFAILRDSDNRVLVEFASKRIAEAFARRWGYFIAGVTTN